MKLKVVNGFYGAENGIDTKLYEKNEIIETDSKDFANILVEGGYAKEEDKKPKGK